MIPDAITHEMPVGLTQLRCVQLRVSHDHTSPHPIPRLRPWLVVDTLTVQITYDAAKRLHTLHTRGLDFAHAAAVFEGHVAEMDDLRKDYRERRVICYRLLAGCLVVIGYTPRGAARHVFSMRKANAREEARFGPHIRL